MKFRWIFPATVFAAVFTFGVPEAKNAIEPWGKIKRPICKRFPVPQLPTERITIQTPGVQVALSLKTNRPHAQHIIRVALFKPPRADGPERKVTVHLGDTSRRARLFEPIIREAARRHQVDAALVKAIIMAESAYDPFAVSRKGARGLMQLMPETARDLGVEDMFNPAQNINGGVRYIKQLLMLFKGEIPQALAAYNAGLARVMEHRGVPPYEATQEYVQKVLFYYEYFQKSAGNKKNA